MNIIEIDSTPMPTPIMGGYTVMRSDLDSENTGRSEDGVLMRIRVREGVYKLEVVWRVDISQLSTVTTALSPAKISVKFYDLTTGTFVTKDMYVGDRKALLLNRIDVSAQSGAVCEYACSLIEY